MKIKLLLSLAVVTALSQGAFAQPTAPQGMAVVASAPGKGMMARKVRVNAAVVAIDAATRTATLKNSRGELFDLVVPPEIKKFDGVKVGDLLVVEYAQALSLELKKGGGIREGSVNSASAPAPAGAVGGGAVGQQVRVLTDVVAIDHKAGTVTLKGPKGKVVEVGVPDPAQLKLAKVGDQVEVTYTEAVAITVERAKK